MIIKYLGNILKIGHKLNYEEKTLTRFQKVELIRFTQLKQAVKAEVSIMFFNPTRKFRHPYN